LKNKSDTLQGPGKIPKEKFQAHPNLKPNKPKKMGRIIGRTLILGSEKEFEPNPNQPIGSVNVK